jgi:hypothetical protein
MFVLAVRFCGSAMRLRRGFVLFRGLVVRVFHVIFSLLAEKSRLHTPAAPIVAVSSANDVFIKRTSPMGAGPAEVA